MVAEFEGREDQAQKAYNKEISKIEIYYKEKGVGSPDFIAFGDALRMAALNSQYMHWLVEEQRQQHQEGLLRVREHISHTCIRIDAEKDIENSHEEMYPGFSKLYSIAQMQILNTIKSSPYPADKRIDVDNYISIHPAYIDLLNVRKKIIGKSAGATPKAH